MVKATLVDADMEAGEKLLRTLDEAGLEVTAAFWFYSSETGEWKLIIACQEVTTDGPKQAYEKVQEHLGKLREQYNISLQNVSLVSPTNDIVKLLGTAIKTGPTVKHIRFTRNVINNVFVEDAYIYRLT